MLTTVNPDSWPLSIAPKRIIICLMLRHLAISYSTFCPVTISISCSTTYISLATKWVIHFSDGIYVLDVMVTFNFLYRPLTNYCVNATYPLISYRIDIMSYCFIYVLNMTHVMILCIDTHGFEFITRLENDL